MFWRETERVYLGKRGGVKWGIEAGRRNGGSDVMDEKRIQRKKCEPCVPGLPREQILVALPETTIC